jgi:hypothetical protein
MPVMSMPVVVAEYPAIVPGVDEMVDVSQVVAGYDTVILPDFISDGAIAALAGHRKRPVDDLCFRHGIIYHVCTRGIKREILSQPETST